jgi:hypothetical protein
MPIRQIPGMRRRLFATLLFCAAIALLANRVGAQSPAMNAGVIDYPVPRPMAAYAIFDDPTDALCPTTVRTIAAELSGSFSDPNITPAFAVEVAPILLSKDLTLSEYLASRLERVVL